MKVEFEKKMRIASDLLSYCHSKGATEFHTDMTDKNKVTVFTIKAYPVTLSAREMETLQKELYAPRHKEVEQDFWGLMGESENFSELTLVGMMCDEALVETENDTITIVIKRYD